MGLFVHKVISEFIVGGKENKFDLINLCQRLHCKRAGIELCCESISPYGKLL